MQILQIGPLSVTVQLMGASGGLFSRVMHMYELVYLAAKFLLITVWRLSGPR